MAISPYRRAHRWVLDNHERVPTMAESEITAGSRQEYSSHRRVAKLMAAPTVIITPFLSRPTVATAPARA
jgi:hypothetical protein